MALNVNVGLIVFCFICLLSITVFGVEVELKQGSDDVEARRMMIGSRPPRCLERCLKCKPCMPTLVIALRNKKGLEIHHNHNSEDGGDKYYLLVWKCKCGNKLFQP